MILLVGIPDHHFRRDTRNAQHTAGHRRQILAYSHPLLIASVNVRERPCADCRSAHKIVDENYLFMPIGVAKELAISLLQVIGDVEKRSNFKVQLNGDKQVYWEEALRAIDEYKQNKRTEE